MPEKHTVSKKITWLSLGIVLILILAGIFWYLHHEKQYPSTDDTYVQAHIVNIASQVSGPITQIFVNNHQLVRQGQPLFRIDVRPYQYALAQADAKLKLAHEQGQRTFPLITSGKVAPAEGDKIRAKIESATAAFQQAQYDLNHTTVFAPVNGKLANFKVRVGDTVSKGINLFAIVEQNHFWVNANFKETQLKRIKVGQPARIKVDMYPNFTFKGRVQSISPGSGTIFSLLPPENATGNWVKVTQRIPVKITILNPNPLYPLKAGSSAKAIVDTKNQAKN